MESSSWADAAVAAFPRIVLSGDRGLSIHRQVPSREPQQDVLRGCRTVLNPELLLCAFQRLVKASANHDGERCLFHHAGIRTELWYLVENLPVVDNHKMPRLLVACRWSRHAGTQHHFHLLRLYRHVCIASHRCTAHNIFKNLILFHYCFSM